MNNVVLVTGVRGTIGKELIKQLRLNNVDTRIAVRNPQKIFEIDTGGYPVIYFDYEKPDTFYSAFENVEAVFLSVPLWCKRLDQLVLPSIQVAKQSGVKKIVTIGAIGVDLGTDTPLSIFERCIMGSGIDYTILRPNLLMQNFINLAGDSIRKTGKFHLPAGNSHISFVDGRDVATAARMVLCSSEKYNNRICTLTGNESLDHYKIAQILSSVVNRQITYMAVSHNDAKRRLLAKGWDPNVVELMVGLYEIARNGWCEEIRNDLKEIIETDPISFEIFARDFRNNWI